MSTRLRRDNGTYLDADDIQIINRNEIEVGTGKQYLYLKDAMNAITDAGANNPYYIILCSGWVRSLTPWEMIVWKSYVYVEFRDEFKENSNGDVSFIGIDFSDIVNTSYYFLLNSPNSIDFGYRDDEVNDFTQLIGLGSSQGEVILVNDIGVNDSHGDPLGGLYCLSTNNSAVLNDWKRVDTIGTLFNTFYLPVFSNTQIVGSRLKWTLLANSIARNCELIHLGGGQLQINSLILFQSYISGNCNDLSTISSTFDGCEISDKIRNSIWSGCKFLNTEFNCDARNAEFQYSIFDLVTITNANFQDVIFDDACIFRDLRLDNVDFTDAVMPTRYNSKALFLEACLSTNAVTWIDGTPLV